VIRPAFSFWSRRINAPPQGTVCAVVASENDVAERILGRNQTLRRAELRVKRLQAMTAAEVEYSQAKDDHKAEAPDA
jgi:hypothetical protein